MSLLFLIILNRNTTPFWHPKSVTNNNIHVSIWLLVTSTADWQRKCVLNHHNNRNQLQLHIHDTIVTPSEEVVLISWVNLYYKAQFGTFLSIHNTGVSSFQGVLIREVPLYNTSWYNYP